MNACSASPRQTPPSSVSMSRGRLSFPNLSSWLSNITRWLALPSADGLVPATSPPRLAALRTFPCSPPLSLTWLQNTPSTELTSSKEIRCLERQYPPHFFHHLAGNIPTRSASVVTRNPTLTLQTSFRSSRRYAPTLRGRTFTLLLLFHPLHSLGPMVIP